MNYACSTKFKTLLLFYAVFFISAILSGMAAASNISLHECAICSIETLSPSIQRHRTVIVRQSFSVPMKLLEKHGFLNGEYSIFDYGCGRGDDVRLLQLRGINVTGWDPYWRSDTEKKSADIVSLGFVLNVIESPTEREETLKEAWALTNKLLVVSARVASKVHVQKFIPFQDGVITQHNTFQKYYQQAELKQYIEATLNVEAQAVAAGVFFVFRS